MDLARVVITGIGLTSPNGDTLKEFRESLLTGRSGIEEIEMRYMGKVPAGVCHFDATKYQKRKELRVGTRAGSVAIYCAREAVADAGFTWPETPYAPQRIGVYVGTTEHGNVETENEIHNISQFDYDTRYWTHHHNPRTVANNPAGEITINMKITGPHYAIGAACAAGNAGLVQAVQMLRLGEVDMALAGGVSESIHTFGIFAGFKSQGALGHHADVTRASRPFDAGRNGIVVSEGGAIYVLERLEDAQRRGARIIAEIIGYHMNSDALDYVLPCAERQAECMRAACANAGIEPSEIDIVSTHATSTPQGDVQECEAVGSVFEHCPQTYINNTKSFIGHAMGAAGALELAGNLPSFTDGLVHPTINVDELDPACNLPNLVIERPRPIERVDTLLNNSFGMLGINSALIVRRFRD
ncbi:MAG: beta-ketoacyl-[acyl-carrier-protein] synthase family protein [Verrucomicrobiota bacterium]